ncbi:hypothetical protein BKA65DRAFT_496920 [Rhexocercosporidium sp. MPI-PUGE-AT-0058]|nr:hypothetical protein BKA65DRAFT_496920 [Rhexocercosporidium sp. MPI-PUGE-AT-0058]
MSIGKINTSFASGTIENTLALANFNLDFSIIKVEAPKEFMSLGANLTPQRRADAEDGHLHRTARKLGALFEQILPATPQLIKSYGIRASEISKTEAVNPKGDHKHGAFAAYVGADATSIWAAATSGPAAIGVHLLACMLARTWTGPEATSIWVEIVEERVRLVMSKASSDAYNTSLGGLVAAKQGVTRAELAQWDASARAWLQVADDAKQFQQKQLMLILKNISLPVNRDQNAYDNVIGAWQESMKAVEKLASGQPQSVSKGAILLGLSAWHLYPDLLVFGDKVSNIKFSDTSLIPGGSLTIGLQNRSPVTGDGVYWSLALSHLRYYGDPVIVDTSLGQGTSRLSLDELHLVALGSFFVALWDCLQRARASEKYRESHMSRHIISSSSWISMLCKAATRALGPADVDRDLALSLIYLGRRRGDKFLAEAKFHPPPAFGLCVDFNLELLSTSQASKQNEKVVMMRSIAEQMNLHPGRSIIRIIRQGSNHCYEYATAVKHRGCSQLHSHSLHQRWVETTYEDTFRGCTCHHAQRSCESSVDCECLFRGTICTPLCHDRSSVARCSANCSAPCSSCRPSLMLACSNLIEDEVYHYIRRGSFLAINAEDGVSSYYWGDHMYRLIKLKYDGNRINNYLIRHTWTREAQKTLSTPPVEIPRLCGCYLEPSVRLEEETIRGEDSNRGNSPPPPRIEEDSTVFNAIVGEVKDTVLFCTTFKRGSKGYPPRYVQRIAGSILRNSSASMSNIATTTKALRETVLPESLLRYIVDLTYVRRLAFPLFKPCLHVHVKNLDNFMRSLIALSLVTELYRSQLPGATVAIDIILQPVYAAAWVPESKTMRETFMQHRTASLDRTSMLSCIAMFESGSHNLRPEDLKDVMGIAVRNTIYASKTLLLDPYELSHRDEIAMIIGNVGRTGMALMVSPPTPRIRSSELNAWKRISHDEFDLQSKDNFETTSLHLSFTEFELPMDKRSRGAIDKDISLVETLVSVHDKGGWLADIDVLALFEHDSLLLRRALPCGHCHHTTCLLPTRLTSLDNWDEILDLPEDIGVTNVGVVRAHNNWLGRLAAACVGLQKGHRIVILPPGKICWQCICQRSWDWPVDKKFSKSEDANDSDSDSQHSTSSEISGVGVTHGFQNEESEEKDLLQDSGFKQSDASREDLVDSETGSASSNERPSEYWNLRDITSHESVDRSFIPPDNDSDGSDKSVITAIGDGEMESRSDDFDSEEEEILNPRVPRFPAMFIL